MTSSRFEITGMATDVFTLAEILAAIRAEGAQAVNTRHAFGMSNQPRVVTFRAADRHAARALCDRARARLRPGFLPALIPWEYSKESGR